jgi:hypothetical protein
MVDQSPTYLHPAVKAYYDRAPEESRLEIGPYRLKELRSRELILRHARTAAEPPGCRQR